MSTEAMMAQVCTKKLRAQQINHLFWQLFKSTAGAMNYHPGQPNPFLASIPLAAKDQII
jgi:hypothetical protein